MGARRARTDAHAVGRGSRGGTIGSKRRPPDQARTSVLVAADRLFYDRGIRAVGVDAIAEAAGVTKRTLYYHFPTKEALVTSYLEGRDGPTRLAIENLVSSNGALPGDRILAVFDHLAKWFASPAYHGCPFNNAVAEQAGTEAAAVALRHKAAVSSWLSDQAQLGGARSPRTVGAQLLVLVDGALNGAAVFGSPEPARAARSVAEVLLASAGVKTSGVRSRRPALPGTGAPP
jgi:AcrR family transcriptional regulator